MVVDCIRRTDVVDRIEPLVDIASVGSRPSIIALITDCAGSKDVVNTTKAIVDIASMVCKSSGVALIVDCACSTDVVDGVESAVGTTFTGIVPLTIISDGNGETTQGAQVTVESIIGSVVASVIDYVGSSGGAERVQNLVDRVTAIPSILNSVVAMIVVYIRANDVVEGVAGSIIIDGIGATEARDRSVRLPST